MNCGHPIVLISVISQSEGITKELGRKIQGKQRWSPVVPGEIGQAMLYSTFKGGGGGYDQMQGQAFMPGKRRRGGVGWRVQRCSKSLSWLKIIESPNGYPGINGHRSGKAMVSLGRYSTGIFTSVWPCWQPIAIIIPKCKITHRTVSIGSGLLREKGLEV